MAAIAAARSLVLGSAVVLSLQHPQRTGGKCVARLRTSHPYTGDCLRSWRMAVPALSLRCRSAAVALSSCCRSPYRPCTLPSNWRLRALPAQPAPARWAAAQPADCLPLLPSGPDGVQQRRLARDQTFNTTYAGQTPQAEPWGREFSPAIADCRYRVPLVPRLARPGKGTLVQQQLSSSTGAAHLQLQKLLGSCRWAASVLAYTGGEGGIRTHVPLTRQHALQACTFGQLGHLSLGQANGSRRTAQRQPQKPAYGGGESP